MIYKYTFQYKNRRAKGFIIFKDLLEALNEATSHGPNKINRTIYDIDGRVICQMSDMCYED